jgi:hypothetical protein
MAPIGSISGDIPFVFSGSGEALSTRLLVGAGVWDGAGGGSSAGLLVDVA